MDLGELIEHIEVEPAYSPKEAPVREPAAPERVEEPAPA
jgi:hypothetical protein